jgi:hypothetical protein
MSIAAIALASCRLAVGQGKAIDGNITHRIEETLPTATEEPQTSLAARLAGNVEPAPEAELAIVREVAEPEFQIVPAPELAIARVEELGPLIVLAAELGIVPEVARTPGQPTARVVDRPLAQVVEVEDAHQAPDQPTARVVAAVRIASVTVAYPQVTGVGAPLGAADAAEAPPAPRAAGAVIAWGVVAAVAAAAVAVAVAVGGDKKQSTRNKPMKSKSTLMTRSQNCLTTSATVIAWLALAATTQAQKQFDTPQQAADSLIQAAGAFDVASLSDILGPNSGDLISSQDPVADKNRALAFAAKAKEKTAIEKEGKNEAILAVGNDEFELPIPLIKNKGKWSFDAKIGREEILNRRIGANELDAIEICRGYDDAQLQYAAEKHDDSKVNQYAQQIISTPGKHDGLAWKNPDGTWGGPVGEEVAKAIEQGYSDKAQPYHGYYFKVLKGQGPNAPLGKMDFVVEGAMIGGFALAAAPAQYKVTGVMSFIVGPDGVVHQKDLGPDTLRTFQSMDTYNPDKTWKVTNDDWPGEEESGADQPPADQQ